MTNIPKELQELRANVEILNKKYKEIRAEMPENHDNKMRDMEDLMWQLISRVHERISYVEDGFYNYTYQHSVGHIPAIAGAGQMEDCLKTLGLNKDYQVYKPMIAAASTKYGFDIK